jgi:hypothetical protein
MVAYERTAGTALAMVQGLCRHLCGTAGFSATTQPTLTEVGQIRDQAYYKIAGELGYAGYDLAMADTDALGWLERLQTLEMVIRIEQAYPVTGAGEPNARFETFVTERDHLTELINTDTLERLGATRSHTLSEKLDVSGMSIADRDNVRNDPDFVGSRFLRGQFTNPGGSTSSPDAGTDRIG